MNYPRLFEQVAPIRALVLNLVVLAASATFHSTAVAEHYDVTEDTFNSIHEYVHRGKKTAKPQDTSPVKTRQLDLQDLFWNNSALTSEHTSFNYFLCGADSKSDSKKGDEKSLPTLSGFNNLYETTTEMMSQQITLLSPSY